MVRASRQVEKSTFLVNAIVHVAVTMPGVTILFAGGAISKPACFEDVAYADRARQPSHCSLLLGAKRRKLGVRDLQFANGSTLHVRPPS